MGTRSPIGESLSLFPIKLIGDGGNYGKPNGLRVRGWYWQKFLSPALFTSLVMERVNVEVINNNMFIVEFSSLRDRQRVLTYGPWNLFRNLVFFFEIHKSSRISSLKFVILELWIQVHNILLCFKNWKCARVIGNHIGQLTEVAMGDNGECWGRFLRFRFIIDITKPLKRVLKLCLKEGSSPEMMLLQYERLPLLCFRCDRLGHKVREYLEEAIKDEASNEVFKFG